MKGSRSAVGSLAVPCVVLILIDTNYGCFFLFVHGVQQYFIPDATIRNKCKQIFCSSEMSLYFNPGGF